MLVKCKNEKGIECSLTMEECRIIYSALRHYSAYGKETDVLEQITDICEIMNGIDVEED